MTIQQFIEKACEGGWMWNREVISHYDVSTNTFGTKDGNTWFRPDYAVILLDPLSWKAVGKVEGWDGSTYENGKEYQQENGLSKYIAFMHLFIDHLCDGLNQEEALDKATS